MSAGIDYGMGTTNRDMANGIRYGVIHANEIGQAWFDSSESQYGEPTCGKCGNQAYGIGDDDLPSEDERADWDDEGSDYACPTCERSFWSDDAFGDEPVAFTLDDGEYVAEQSGDDYDIFITRSPYYTYAPFCSPCAPGAGYLGLANDKDETSGVKTYCFGHDWFEDGTAPYRVFKVADDSEVLPASVDTLSLPDSTRQGAEEGE